MVTLLGKEDLRASTSLASETWPVCKGVGLLPKALEKASVR